MKIFYSRLLPRHYIVVDHDGTWWLVPRQRQGWLFRYGSAFARSVGYDCEVPKHQFEKDLGYEKANSSARDI